MFSPSTIEELPDDKKKQLVVALGKAIRHSLRISKREHLKANRAERVDLFVVSLRREISYLFPDNRKPIVSELCSKSIWYDTGRLTPETWPSGSNSVRRSAIEPLLEQAKRQVETVDVQCDTILDGIEDMERMVKGLHLTADEAERINEQSEEVLEQLSAVFD